MIQEIAEYIDRNIQVANNEFDKEENTDKTLVFINPEDLKRNPPQLPSLNIHIPSKGGKPIKSKANRWAREQHAEGKTLDELLPEYTELLKEEIASHCFVPVRHSNQNGSFVSIGSSSLERLTMPSRIEVAPGVSFADSTPYMAVAYESAIAKRRADLGYATAPALERPLIDALILAEQRLGFAESLYGISTTASAATLNVIEQRLDGAHRHYLRLVEAFASDGMQTVGVAVEQPGR